MKRLLHWLFNLTALVSALLCIVTVALWGRSYFGRDWVSREANSLTDDKNIITRVDHASTFRGTFSLMLNQRSRTIASAVVVQFVMGAGTQWHFQRTAFASSDPSWRNWGIFRYETFQTPVGRDWVTTISIAFPFWTVFLVLAIFPILACRQLLRRATRRKCGACLHCGYDLRATPERCPECGMVPQTVEAKKA